MQTLRLAQASRGGCRLGDRSCVRLTTDPSVVRHDAGGRAPFASLPLNVAGRLVSRRKAGEVDCPRCRSANRHGRRFCGDCGAPLLVECPACGFGNEAEERFCGGCDTALQKEVSPPGAAPGLERMRRQVTVLFADVVGFTPPSELFDPALVHELMDACLA